MDIDQEVLDILKRTEAVIADSHIVGTKGGHMSVYINKDAIYPHTKETFRLCQLFAEKVKDLDVEVVVGPVIGGVILEQLVSYHLSLIKNKDILGVYAEKTPEGGITLVSRRNYDQLVKGKKVLVEISLFAKKKNTTKNLYVFDFNLRLAKYFYNNFFILLNFFFFFLRP